MPALQRVSYSLMIVLVAALGASVLPARAQNSYPSKPVRIVTGGAGSQTDMVVRLIGHKLSERWSQPVVIENRTGAGGAMAVSVVAKAVPDGYTLLLQSSQFSIGAAVDQNLPYNALKDFNGVTQIGYASVVPVVAPALGVRTIKELIALAQAKPGQILFGSAGAALPFIKEGKLPALAVVNPERSPLLPDVPTMREAIPGYQRDGSFGMLAPAGTPRPILSKISADVKGVFDHSDIKERLQSFGFIPAPTTPEEFDRIVRADIETFTKVAKLVGLRTK